MTTPVQSGLKAALALLASVSVALLVPGLAQAVPPTLGPPTVVPQQPNPTNEVLPSFVISGEAGTTFACRIDDEESFTACTSPLTIGPLADGQHTLSVIQIDADGNESEEAAIYSFEVDTIVPDSPGLSLYTPSAAAFPVEDTGSATTERSARVEFSSIDPDEVTYQCALDGAPAVECESPFTGDLSNLPDGDHTLSVTQTDEAGNVSEASAVSWTVDNAAPADVTVTDPAGASSWTSSTVFRGSDSESFAWTRPTDSGSAISAVCSLDGGPDEQCDDSIDLSVLPDGPHTLKVTAVDAAGNRAAGVTIGWTTDTARPEPPSVRSTPSGFTKSTSASVSISGEGGATFSCSLNGAPAVACTSPYALSGLDDGVQEVAVTQVDRAGNESEPAIASWTVDNGAPEFTTDLESNRIGTTAHRTAELSWAATDDFSAEADITASCRLTWTGSTGPVVGVWVACASPKAVANVAVGPVTFEVKIRDQAGNEAIQSVDWTVAKLSVTKAPELDADSASDLAVGSLVTATAPEFADSSDDYTDTSVWQRCAGTLTTSCSSIPGTAGSDTYTPGADDIGRRLRIVVTRTTDDGASLATASAMTGIVIPVAATPTSIGGLTSAFDGATAAVPAYLRTLTANPVAWTTGVGGRATAYRWQRCASSSSGPIEATCATIVLKTVAGVIDWADDPTYQVRLGDLGRRLRVLSGVNVGGGKYIWSASPVSLPVKVVGESTTAPALVLRPGATAPKRLKPISLSVGTWRYTYGVSYRYRWRLCSSDGAGGFTCSDITGATRSSYVPTSANVGKRLQARVTYVGKDGTQVSALTPMSAVVGN